MYNIYSKNVTLLINKITSVLFVCIVYNLKRNEVRLDKYGLKPQATVNWYRSLLFRQIWRLVASISHPIQTYNKMFVVRICYYKYM